MTPSESQKTLAMILPTEGDILNLSGSGNPLWHHSVLDWFDSGVK
jgi:hypothetical protein